MNGPLLYSRLFNFICLFVLIYLFIGWLIDYLYSFTLFYVYNYVYLLIYVQLYLFIYLFIFTYIYSCTLIFNHIHYQKSTFINFISFFQRSGTTIFLFLEPRLSPITVKKRKINQGAFAIITIFWPELKAAISFWCTKWNFNSEGSLNKMCFPNRIVRNILTNLSTQTCIEFIR